MGMFDTIVVEGLFDKELHNAVHYQSKSLACDGSDYVIRDRRMFLRVPGPDALVDVHASPEPVDFTGELNIYGTYNDRVGAVWVEYDLTMLAGTVTGIVMLPLRYSSYHDMARFRPSDTPRVTVSIDLGHASVHQRERFDGPRLAATLDAIRETIGDPQATIAFRSGPSFRWLHHVVQPLTADLEVQEVSAVAARYVSESLDEGCENTGELLHSPTCHGGVATCPPLK